MHDVLVWLETAAVSTWVRESGSLWAYPTVLAAHTVGMSLLVGANAVLDLRLLGVAPLVPLGPLVVVFRGLWAGAAVSFVSGLLLFCADATTKGTTPVFLVKLTLIAAALAVARRLRRTIYRPDTDTVAIPLAAKALAVASLLLWAGAITAGRFMAYLTPGPS